MFQTKIIVRGFHLDVYGHVNNARYLEFLEEARWAACDNKEEILGWFMQQRIALTVQRIEVDYKRPAFMGDHLIVETSVVQREAKHWLVAQNITRQQDNKTIITANVYFCLVTPSQRGALAIEGELADKLVLLLGVNRGEM